VAVGAGIILLAGIGAFYATSSTTRPSGFGRIEETLTPSEERAYLERMAKAYWKARVEGELATAFSFEDPVRQKALGKKGYRRKIDARLNWKEVQVENVRILPGGELADVELVVRYEARVIGEPIAVTSRATDHWQKLDGQWYHVLETVALPTGRRPTIPGTKPKGAG
jgi:uncharacterized protein YchJ